MRICISIFDDSRGHDSQAKAQLHAVYYHDANISYVNVKLYRHNIVGVGGGDRHSRKDSGERRKLIRQSTLFGKYSYSSRVVK